MVLTKQDKEEFKYLFGFLDNHSNCFYQIALELKKDLVTPGRLKGVAEYTRMFASGSSMNRVDDEFSYGDFPFLKRIAERDYPLILNTPSGWNDKFYLAHAFDMSQERKKESANKLMENAMAGLYEGVTERGFELNNFIIYHYVIINPERNWTKSTPDDRKTSQTYYRLNAKDIRVISNRCKLSDEDLAQNAKHVLNRGDLELTEQQEDNLIQNFLPSRLRDDDSTKLVDGIFQKRQEKKKVEDAKKRLDDYRREMAEYYQSMADLYKRKAF